MWFLYVLIPFIVILLVAFLLLCVLHKASLGVPLLRATVKTQDARTYFVALTELNMQATPVEYVWLTLLSAAKMLYVMGNDSQFAKSRSDLLRAIETLSHHPLQRGTDVIGLCERTLTVVEAALDFPTKLRFVAKVGFLTETYRGFHTKIPWSASIPEDFYPDCWLAIVAAALPRLDEELLARLHVALHRMARAYRSGQVDPASRFGLRLPAMCLSEQP